METTSPKSPLKNEADSVEKKVAAEKKDDAATLLKKPHTEVGEVKKTAEQKETGKPSSDASQADGPPRPKSALRQERSDSVKSRVRFSDQVSGEGVPQPVERVVFWELEQETIKAQRTRDWSFSLPPGGYVLTLFLPKRELPSPTRKLSVELKVISDLDPTYPILGTMLVLHASMDASQAVTRSWSVPQQRAPATFTLTFTSHARTRSMHVSMRLEHIPLRSESSDPHKDETLQLLPHDQKARGASSSLASETVTTSASTSTSTSVRRRSTSPSTSSSSARAQSPSSPANRDSSRPSSLTLPTGLSQADAATKGLSSARNSLLSQVDFLPGDQTRLEWEAEFKLNRHNSPFSKVLQRVLTGHYVLTIRPTTSFGPMHYLSYSVSMKDVRGHISLLASHRQIRHVRKIKLVVPKGDAPVDLLLSISAHSLKSMIGVEIQLHRVEWESDVKRVEFEVSSATEAQQSAKREKLYHRPSVLLHRLTILAMAVAVGTLWTGLETLLPRALSSVFFVLRLVLLALLLFRVVKHRAAVSQALPRFRPRKVRARLDDDDDDDDDYDLEDVRDATSATDPLTKMK